jgi:hypothetical protein
VSLHGCGREEVMPITHTRNDWRRDAKPSDGEPATPEDLDDTVPGGRPPARGGSGGAGGQGSIEGSGSRGGQEPQTNGEEVPGTGDRIHRGESGRDQVEGRRGGPQDERVEDGGEGTVPARD